MKQVMRQSPAFLENRPVFVSLAVQKKGPEGPIELNRTAATRETPPRRAGTQSMRRRARILASNSACAEQHFLIPAAQKDEVLRELVLAAPTQWYENGMAVTQTIDQGKV